MNRTGFVALLLLMNVAVFLAVGNTFAIEHPVAAAHQTPGQFIDHRQLPSTEMEIIPAVSSNSFYTIKRFQQHDDIQGGSIQSVYRCQEPGSNFLIQSGVNSAKKYLTCIYPSHNFW